MKAKRLIQFLVGSSLALSLVTVPALAQKAKKKDAEQGDRETIAKPLSARDQKRREDKLRKELYKEEHYRRIAYANERFASGIPGWKADRGRIYITFGPPDEIEDHPSGGTYQRPIEEGGGTTSTFPFQKWRYRYIDGIGNDVMIEFVDTTMTGEFRMTMDPSEKDALLYVPNAGLTMYEQMGMSSKNDRFTRTDGTRLGTGNQALPQRMNQFERLQQFALLQKPPAVKFKDLEASVNSKVTFNVLPIMVRTDFVRLTNSTVMTYITIQMNKGDLQFKSTDSISKAMVNIYARITSMTRRVVNVWETPVVIETPSVMLAEASKGKAIYQNAVPLPPGTYRVNVVAKDVVGGNMNNYEMAITVPRFEDERLGASSLILADMIEKVPTKNIGAGQFVIGTSKVRPRLNDAFTQNEKMGIYQALYNFTPDEKTQKPLGNVSYEISKADGGEKVIEFTEALSEIPGASATQVTIEKLLPLQNFAPGRYTLKLKVTDQNSNQSLVQTANFSVAADTNVRASLKE
ncbi:MAG: GWxTD domain-containing protein [Acidobacteria bacterium]|nr:GWxTD domain-containing protein [Acidobacteriota bacterium]